MKPRSNIQGGPEEGVLVFKVVVKRKVLGDESQLRKRDVAVVVVLERKLELGEAVEELAGELVEENGGVAVEFGREPEGRPFGKAESGSRRIDGSDWSHRKVRVRSGRWDCCRGLRHCFSFVSASLCPLCL